MLDPLTKTVAFLNEMSQFEIFVLQVQRFKDREQRGILVPSLAEMPPRTITAPPWYPDRFFAEMTRRCPEDVVAVGRKLYDFAVELSQRGEGFDVTWGKGAVSGSFTCKKLIGSSWVTLFTVYSNGKLSLDFGPNPKVLLSQTLETFHRTMTEIPGVNLPPDVLDKGVSRYPYLPLQLLVEPDHLEKFKEAIRALVGSSGSPAA